MSSAKLVDVSLKVAALLVLEEDEAVSIELLDETAALLDDEELGALLEELVAAKLDELGVSVGAGVLLPDDPPPQAVNMLAVNKNDKKLVLINFMAITCSRFNQLD